MEGEFQLEFADTLNFAIANTHINTNTHGSKKQEKANLEKRLIRCMSRTALCE